MNLFSSTGIPCLIGVLLIIGNVSGAHLSIGDVYVDTVGGTATADLVMDVAPADGFSGYWISIDIANPSIANITAVTYNTSLGGMTETTDLPFSSGHISWVDVNEVLQAPGGDTDLKLATLTFRGLSSGSTTLNTALVMVSDDDGDNMIPQMTIDTPSITVAPDSTSSGSSGSSSSGSTSSGTQTGVSATVTGSATTQVTAIAHTTTRAEAMNATRTLSSEKATLQVTSTPATTHATPAPTTDFCIGTVIGAISCAVLGSFTFIRRRNS